MDSARWSARGRLAREGYALRNRCWRALPVDDRAVALLVIFLATLFALIWVFRVPPLQQPDESAHADYAFAIHDAGSLFLHRTGGKGDDVTPQLRAIEDATAFRSMRYTPFGKVPAGYGSRAYFTRLDQFAPAAVSAGKADRIPYVALCYPFGYYALAAVAASIGDLASSGSLTVSFFAMRLLGVALLVIGLVAVYGTLRYRRIPRLAALLVLVAIAFLPLTSWVCAYVQPDALSFATFALGLFLVARANATKLDTRVAVLLGLDLGVMALTKQHYALCFALPLMAWYAMRWPLLPSRLSRVRSAFLIFAPLVLCWLLGNVIILANGTPISVGSTIAVMGAAARTSLPHLLGVAALSIREVFLDGAAFKTFWGAFSWVDYPVRFGSDSLTTGVRVGLAIATTVTAAAVATNQAVLAKRLRHVAARRGLRTVLTLLTSDVGAWAYAIFTLSVMALYVRSDALFGLQGRYWLPLIVPTFLFPVVYATLTVKAGPRRNLRLAVAGVLAIYSLIAAPLAIASVGTRFYDHSQIGPPTTWLARFQQVSSSGVELSASAPVVKRGAVVLVQGYALDYRTGLPGAAVDLLVDGNSYRKARYGEPRENVAIALNDDATLRSGFTGTVETLSLRPGSHSIELLLQPKDHRMAALRSLAKLELTVTTLPPISSEKTAEARHGRESAASL